MGMLFRDSSLRLERQLMEKKYGKTEKFGNAEFLPHYTHSQKCIVIPNEV